jgi:ABC-type polysaccharide/polyol phosphate export permease
MIDVSLQTILIALLLIIGFNTQFTGGIIFLFMAQVMGILFFGVGTILSPLVRRIPDFLTVIQYVLRLGFYISPAMYPMARMEGIHFKANEFNPFAYFAELARYLTGAESVFPNLNFYVFIIFVLMMALLTIIGFRRIDHLRWRMTSWS